MLVKVDHRDIRVIGIPEHPKHAGVFKDRECLIEIVNEQSSQQQADTLIHEILHAIWATRGLPDKVCEEECVTRLASGLATVIRDNAALWHSIGLALKGELPLFQKGE